MLEWPRRMNRDPSKRSKHQILTLPPWTWTWHKGVLWSETTNGNPCRPREVAANWSNPARQKTNSPQKRRLLDDNHPTRETWWAEATSPLEYWMPEEYLLYLRLKKKGKPIPPTLLQYLWGSTDHQSRQGDKQSERWSTQVAKANMEGGQ